MSELKDTTEFKRTFPWKLVVIFLLFSGVIIVMGIYYYRYERNRIFEEQEKSLSAIASLKIKQISLWYGDKIADAVLIKNNEPLVGRIKEFLKDENHAGIRKEIAVWLEALNTQYDYYSVALLDTSLKVRIATSNTDPLADDSIRKEIKNVIRYHKIIMTDLHKTGTSLAIRMNLLVPLLDPLSKEQKTIGIVILCIDPDKILFPLVQSWPIPSRSSETLILRREGDSVLYLNELRHRKNSALNLKLPLIEKDLLALKVVNGFEGVTEGIDYRNIPVIGALSKIPGLPWFMVAKTDKEEILVPFNRYSVITIIVIVLLILINASVFGFWIWQQRIKFYKNQLKSDLAIHELEERFTTAFRMSPVSVTISSMSDNKFIDVNNTFLEDMEYKKEEVIGRTAKELNIWADENEREWIIKEMGEKAKVFGKVISYRSKTGKILYGLSSMSVVNVNGEPCNLSTTVNITETRKAEEALQEMREIFHVAIDQSHAGIAIADAPDGKLRYVNDAGLLIRGGDRQSIIDEIGIDQYVASWNLFDLNGNPLKSDEVPLARAVMFGEVSSREFIIRRTEGDDRIVIANAAPVRNVNRQVVAGIVVFMDITESKKNEEDLKESELKFRQTFDLSPIGIVMVGLNKKFLRCNDAFSHSLGYRMEELVGRSIAEVTYPEDIEIGMAEMMKIATGELESSHILKRYLRIDGQIVWGDVLISLIRNNSGEPQYFLAIIQDITESKKIVEALRESEDKFKYVFDHSVIGKSITFPSGEIHVNEAFCHMLGYSQTELECIKWQNITHSDDIERTEKELQTLLSGEKDSMRIIKRYIHKDGSVIWTDLSTSLRREAAGNPLYFMTSVIDITELKNAEEILRNDEKRFRELIEALPQLYWTCRIDGPCDFLSKQWVEYTGIQESDQLGYKWLEQLHPEDKEKAITTWAEKVKNGNSFDIEFRIRRYDGEYHWFKTRAVPIHDSEGRLIKWLGSNTDIDNIRRAEDQMRNYNKDLEQRVILRTEQLEAANKELEAFSYSVSHDLRAPLRSVHGFTKILLEDYESNLDDDGRRICGIISSSATQMGELIDDLLSFSRIGRSSMNPLLLDMNSIVHSVFEEASTASQKSKTKLKIGKLHKAIGDANLLKIVWTNLISNAIKYSSKEDNSEISIRSGLKDHSVAYSIKDNGVGFDMAYKQKLFGVFQRLHSESEFEGNGVGLAIVQRIILKHGGKVWAEGEVGKGATFYFSLPVQDK